MRGLLRRSLRQQAKASAGGGSRTHTPLRIRDFESRASASFTTPACRAAARLVYQSEGLDDRDRRVAAQDCRQGNVGGARHEGCAPLARSCRLLPRECGMTARPDARIAFGARRGGLETRERELERVGFVVVCHARTFIWGSEGSLGSVGSIGSERSFA